MLLVLLAWFLEFDPPTRPYEVVEFYAGVGRIAGMAKYAGMSSAAVDLEYGKDLGAARGSRPPMDINSNAGLLPLGSTLKCISFSASEVFRCVVHAIFVRPPKQNRICCLSINTTIPMLFIIKFGH